MTRYAILRRDEWNGRDPVAAHPNAEIVSLRDLHARVTELLDRNPLASYPSVATKLRRDGRVYLAAQNRRDGGILVEKVLDTDRAGE